MEISEIEEKVKTIHRGAIFTVIQEKDVQPKKKFQGLKIRKVSHIKGRLVRYDHQSDVIEMKKEGSESRPSKLIPIGKGLFLDQEKKKIKFCFCPSRLKNHKGESKWFLDEKEVDYDEIEPYITSRDKKKKTEAKYYTLNSDNIKEILYGNRNNGKSR